MFKKTSIISGVIAASLFVMSGCSSSDEAATKEKDTEVTQVKSEVDIASKIDDAKTWALERVDGIISNTKLLEDAINAGDLEKAKEQWVTTQLEYEKGEALFATLSAELDETMDVSTSTGFHGIEQILWGEKDPLAKKEELLKLTGLLTEDAKKLKNIVTETELNEQILYEAMTGILPELSGFVEAVYTGESISGTRIEDARNVFEGVQTFYEAVAPKVKEASVEVDEKVQQQMNNVLDIMGEEKPDVETVDQEFGALFNVMVESASTIGVEL